MSTLSDYNPRNMRRSQIDHYESEKTMQVNDPIMGHGPIKVTEQIGMNPHGSLNTDTISSEFNHFDDNASEKHYRYTQSSNKSMESRNRNKGSFSQKKPPIKNNKKFRPEMNERPLSIDARSNDDSMSEKILTPEAEWKNVLTKIKKKNDWESQFKACNTIKDFSVEHPKFFSNSDSCFQEIIKELGELWNSLRTQLSRNALGTFAIVFENLGKKSDVILESIIPMLLKKAADTNAFIAEEAEKSLIKACENWTEHKIVSAALSLSKTKVNGIKEKILVAINTIIEKLQDRVKTFKEREKVVAFLASGMNEAALEVRNAAKSGFLILKSWLPNSEFERLILRSTSERDYTKVIDFLEKESTQSDRFTMTNGISTKGTFYYNKTKMGKLSKPSVASEAGDYGDIEPIASSTSTKGKFSRTNNSMYKRGSSTSSGYGKSNFELIDSTTMTKFEDIIKQFDDSDWKKRVSALKSLSNFVQEEEKLIKKSKKFFSIIDVLVKCLKDNNSKVATATQDIFSAIMPHIKSMIEKGSAQIIEALSANVISSNSLIKNWGMGLMKKLVLSEDLEWSVFIQPMWHQVLQGNARAKATIIGIISEVVEIVFEVKPVSVTKHVYGLCSKLLDDKSIKGETKKALHELIAKWYEWGGDSYINSFPSRHTDKVWNILKSDSNSVFS